MAYNSYRFTPQAKSDIEQAIKYIIEEFGNKSAAKSLYDSIFETIKRICLFPESCEAVDNSLIKNKNVRRALVGSYLLFYLYNQPKSEIVILRFIYEKRLLFELIKEISL